MSRFAIDALMGAFDDEAQFSDPFGLGTIFTVRRGGSNALQKISRERAKGDKLRLIFAQGAFEKDRSAVMELALKAGFTAVDVIAGLAEFQVDDALARLVKWESEPNGVPYNAGNARELLTHDGWLDKDKTPEDAWAILDGERREQHEELMKALDEADRKPYEPMTEIQVGDAYCTFIRFWSKQREKFRSQVLEEAAKN